MFPARRQSTASCLRLALIQTVAEQLVHQPFEQQRAHHGAQPLLLRMLNADQYKSVHRPDERWRIQTLPFPEQRFQ